MSAHTVLRGLVGASLGLVLAWGAVVPAVAAPTTSPTATASPTASASPKTRATPSPSPVATPRVMTPIDQKYAALGGAAGWLGEPTAGEQCWLRDGGCFREYAGGAIYHSPATGASSVRGAIRSRWAALRWEAGRLGYPTSDEVCGLRDGGCAQRFEAGIVYWSPGSGVAAVWGAIGERYAGLRWETSTLGYPVEGEFCGLRDGGCGQRFQGGSIYWSLGSGANPVWGRIRDAYAAQGWEAGGLRYPTTGEGPVVNNMITQEFQGGKLVYHTDTYAVDSGMVPGVVTGGYPDADAAACGGSWCKNGRSMSARGFAYRNCTDFAAWRRGMVWSQINGSGDGNAVGWRQGWIQRGRQVGATPRVGAVAWWGASRGAGYGHLAIVIGVNPDGSARVEHYNYEVPGGYSITESIRAEAYLY